MLSSIAIVDDLEEDRLKLARDIQAYLDSQEDPPVSFSFYPSGEAMLDDAGGTAGIQLAFLDICMEGISGIELAKRLRSLDENMLLVFLSTSREFAFDAFPVHPFDYLVKPYATEDLHRVLWEARRLLGSSEAEITLRAARAVYHVPPRSILSAEARGHTVEIKTSSGVSIRCLMTFAEIEALLGSDPRFLLCNRGVLVNMDYVSALDGELLRMQDGSSHALRTRSRAELVKRFNQNQISRLKRR